VPGVEPLDHVAPVGHQVPAVGHLAGLWRSSRHRLGIGRPAVAGDDFDGRVHLQPGRDRRTVPPRQDVDHAPPLRVDQDRAVSVALLPGPIIDADIPRRRTVFLGGGLDPPQQRVWAGWHCQVVGQAGTGLAAEAQADGSMGVG
jgi:hypothetical protein